MEPAAGFFISGTPREHIPRLFPRMPPRGSCIVLREGCIGSSESLNKINTYNSAKSCGQPLGEHNPLIDLP